MAIVWHPARWSLRARLLAGLIALLAAVCIVVGVVTAIALHRFLLGQLDSQLGSAAGRSVEAANRALQHPPPGPNPFPSDGHAPGQSVGTVSATILNGSIERSFRVDGVKSGGTSLSAAAQQVLLHIPADGKIHSVNLPDLGGYRLVASKLVDGETMITGLPTKDITATMVRLAVIVASVAGAALLFAALIGAFIVRRALRPLHRVSATAARVAELPLDRGEVALSVRVPEGDTDPRTEVGQVGAAINRMLGHVAGALNSRHASEMRVRQFVADASHELRTPLAAIRGYAELTRRSRDAAPPDIAHAMRRVESESTRMTALVEDLLLLARLDSGRPLDRQPVDLAPLVVDAVSDAHIAGPAHSWQLDLVDQPCVVIGDSARLHQALANLLANARTHAPAGTAVTTRLRPIGRAVQLSVVDNGPGIPQALLPEVFERFARGDTSRSRAAGSTGLGLAIVAAVVEAHHGNVRVSSHPGHTEFTITLPLSTMDTHSQRPNSELTAIGKVHG
jgi:two-component system OmpR family sensor kinase